MLEKQLWMTNRDGLEFEPVQMREEGKDDTGFAQRVQDILNLPAGPEQERLAGELLDESRALPVREGYAYVEPDDLPSIRQQAQGIADRPAPTGEALYDHIYGAWLGRCAGCLLGKPYEGWRRRHILGLLKDTGNYPPAFYTSSAIDPALLAKYEVKKDAAWINNVSFMPEDDDTNYTLIGLKILERNGRDFTPGDVAETWLMDLPYLHVCTAERVAYRNLVNMRLPPESAAYRNPYREWIGAQIRADFFGYINPGRMEAAADMAWRDASISHVKNGIYGEMLMAAMIAAAPTTRDLSDIIGAGLAVIPSASRLHAAVRDAMTWPEQGLAWEAALDRVHEKWDEDSGHDWCHTISNAVICVLALLYGQGELERTLGIALLGAMDTDCNAATVGSIVGAMLGAKALPEKWTAPLNDTLLSGVDGFGRVKISDMARRTLPFVQG